MWGSVQGPSTRPGPRVTIMCRHRRDSPATAAIGFKTAMSNQLPVLPSADPARLQPINPAELVLCYLACMKARAAAAPTIARGLRPWGLSPDDVDACLARLLEAGQAGKAGGRFRLTDSGQTEAQRILGGDFSDEPWPAVAEKGLSARALGLDPADPRTQSYIAVARNFYACVLAVLFDLQDPLDRPALGEMRAALCWRIVTARCPDLMPQQGPAVMTGPKDALTRSLYLRFSGLAGGSVDQATPALLRRVLPGPVGAGAAGLRRALVRAALRRKDRPEAATRQTMQRAQPPTAAKAEDFADTVTALARTLKTPKRRGGHFTGSQVAIALLYDAYAAKGRESLSLDDFKARLRAAVRAGADFHLSRLDIPDLMEDDLRKRSATPTRAGDVVHFVVLD